MIVYLQNQESVVVQVDALISESLGDLFVLDSPVLEDNTEPPLVSISSDAKLDDKLLEMHYEFIKGFEFSLDIHEGF